MRVVSVWPQFHRFLAVAFAIVMVFAATTAFVFGVAAIVQSSWSIAFSALSAAALSIASWAAHSQCLRWATAGEEGRS